MVALGAFPVLLTTPHPSHTYSPPIPPSPLQPLLPHGTADGRGPGRTVRGAHAAATTATRTATNSAPAVIPSAI